MANKLTVIKVGGKIVEEKETLNTLLDDFRKIEGNKILVHGGGRSATKIAERLGLETKMVDGRRITDEAMLEVVTMVYGGLVNKNIVAGLQARGLNALGLTGADLNLLLSDRRKVESIDYGWVGDVRQANHQAIKQLIDSGIIPVIAPLSHDGKGNMLNTNADTIAAETAKAAAHNFDVTLVYCFEKEGVLADENDDSSVIPLIDEFNYAELKKNGIVAGGMIPKLDNAFATLKNGVKEVFITKASNISNRSKGTRIIV